MSNPQSGRPKSAIEPTTNADDPFRARGLLWPSRGASSASLPNARRRSYNEVSSSIAPLNWPIRPHSAHQPQASFSHSAVRPRPSSQYVDDRSSLGLSYTTPSSSAPDVAPFDWSTSGPTSPPYVFHPAPMQPSSSLPLPPDSRPIGIPHITRSWTLDSPSCTSLSLPHANLALPLTRSPIPFSALTSSSLTVSPVMSNASGPSLSEGGRRVVSLSPHALIPHLAPEQETPRRASGRRQGGPPKAVLGGPGGKTYEELQAERMARSVSGASSSANTALLTPERHSRETAPSPSPIATQSEQTYSIPRWRGKEIKFRLPPLQYQPPEYPPLPPPDDMPDALPSSRIERYPWPRQHLLATPDHVPLPFTPLQGLGELSRVRWAELAVSQAAQNRPSQEPTYKGKRIKVKIPPENAWEALCILARTAIEARKVAETPSPVMAQGATLPAVPTPPDSLSVEHSVGSPPYRLFEGSSSADDLIVTPEEKSGRYAARHTFSNSGFLKRQLGGLLRNADERHAIEAARQQSPIPMAAQAPALDKKSDAEIVASGDLEEIPLTASVNDSYDSLPGQLAISQLDPAGTQSNKRVVDTPDVSTVGPSTRENAKRTRDENFSNGEDSPSRPAGTAKPPMFGNYLARQLGGLLKPTAERSKRKLPADLAAAPDTASDPVRVPLPAQDDLETRLLSPDIGVTSPASAIHELVDQDDIISPSRDEVPLEEEPAVYSGPSLPTTQSVPSGEEDPRRGDIVAAKRMRPNAPVFMPRSGPSSTASPSNSVDISNSDSSKKARAKAGLRATAPAFRPSHSPSASAASSVGSQQRHPSTVFGAMIKQNPRRGEFNFDPGQYVGLTLPVSRLDPTAKPFSSVNKVEWRSSGINENSDIPGIASDGLGAEARSAFNLAETSRLSQPPFSLWNSLDEVNPASSVTREHSNHPLDSPTGEDSIPMRGEQRSETRLDSDEEDPAFGTAAGSSSALFFRSPAPSPAPSSDGGLADISNDSSVLPLRAEASPRPIIGTLSVGHPLHPSPDPEDEARSPRHERPVSSRVPGNSHLSKETCEADNYMASVRIDDVEVVTIHKSHPVGSRPVSRIKRSMESTDSETVKEPSALSSAPGLARSEAVDEDPRSSGRGLEGLQGIRNSSQSPPRRSGTLNASAPAFVFGRSMQPSITDQGFMPDLTNIPTLSPAAKPFRPRDAGLAQSNVLTCPSFPLPVKPNVAESSTSFMMTTVHRAPSTAYIGFEQAPHDVDHSAAQQSRSGGSSSRSTSSGRFTPIEGERLSGDETPTATGFIPSPAFEHPMSPLTASPEATPTPYITVDPADDDRKFRQWIFPLASLSDATHASRPSISRRHTMPGEQAQLDVPGAGVASTSPHSASFATRVQDLRSFLQAHGHFAEPADLSDGGGDEETDVERLQASNLMSGRPSVSAQSSVEFPVRQDATRAREVEKSLESPASLAPRHNGSLNAEMLRVMVELTNTLKARNEDGMAMQGGSFEAARIAEAIETGLKSMLGPVLPSLTPIDGDREQHQSQASQVQEMMTVLREQSAILHELHENITLKPPHSAFSLSPSPLSASMDIERGSDEMNRTEEMFAALLAGQHALMDKIGSDVSETEDASGTIAAILQTVEALREEQQNGRGAAEEALRATEESIQLARQLGVAQAEIRALRASLEQTSSSKDSLHEDLSGLQGQLDAARQEIASKDGQMRDQNVELDAAVAARLVAESEREAVQKQLNEAKLLVARRDVESSKAHKQLELERNKPPPPLVVTQGADEDGKETFRDEVLSRLVKLDEAMHETMSSRVKEYAQVLDRNRILQAEVDSLRQRLEASADKFAALQLSTTTTLSEVEGEQRVTRDKLEEAQMAREAAERRSECLQAESEKMKEESDVWKMMVRERQATSRLQEMRLQGLAQEVHHWKTFALEIDRSQFKAFVKRNPSLVKKEPSSESKTTLADEDLVRTKMENGGTWYGLPPASQPATGEEPDEEGVKA